MGQEQTGAAAVVQVVMGAGVELTGAGPRVADAGAGPRVMEAGVEVTGGGPGAVAE